MKAFLFLLLALPALGAPQFGGKAPAGLIKWPEPVGYTGSMAPALTGGEYLHYSPPVNLKVGDWVLFWRPSDGLLVIHAITALNSRAIYTAGLANRYSDGWTPRSAVVGRVDFVERRPVSHLAQVRR